MLEKIIQNAAKWIGGAILAGTLVYGGGCSDESSSWWDNGEADPGPMVEETEEYRLTSEELGVDADITDINGFPHEFTRFSFSSAPILPAGHFTPPTGIARTVATVKGSDGIYNLFWLRDVDMIERNAIHLNDGSTVSGEWVQNNSPVNFYFFESYANGMVNEDGADVPMQMLVRNMEFADISGGSFTEFDAQYHRVFDGLESKKDVELTDGRTFSSDLAYILDCCGHHYSNTYHIRMFEDFEIYLTDNRRENILLQNVSEIEFTGNFDADRPQCREAIIRWKAGGESTNSIYLTSESYGGVCTTYSRFRNFDSIIVHNETGAMVIPLNLVKKIIPNDNGAFDPSQTIKNTQMHEGMTITSWYEGDYSGAPMDAAFDSLFDAGVESLSVLTTWYQDNELSTTIYPLSPKTPTDTDVTYALGRAKAMGMRTVLKPHVDPWNGAWRGYIGFTNESDWTDWFSSYTNFITHYAQMAEDNGVDMLVIGTELEGTMHRPEWSQVISDVRSVYSGEITYAANHDGYQSVPFWSELDYIGVDAYFQLTSDFDPTPAALQAAWDSLAAQLENFSNANNGKKIMITEVGYQSHDGANITPWWAPTSVLDEQEQADCYEAMFNALWNKPFIAGIYPWMTYHNPLEDVNGFDVLHKQAETVFQDYYHRMD